MIKLIKFLSEKIVIVEVMLLILSFCEIYFKVFIPYLSNFMSKALVFLTPISIISLIIYIIFSILDHKFIKILLCIILIVLIYLHYIKGV